MRIHMFQLKSESPRLTGAARHACKLTIEWISLDPITVCTCDAKRTVSKCAAGRKHQLRQHCAEVLGAPVVGDGRYGRTRSPPQQRLQQLLRAAAPHLPAHAAADDQAELDRLLRCHSHLLLHCCRVRTPPCLC